MTKSPDSRMASPSSKVWFVGAGPGDPDLITVKGRRLIEAAGAILYAGSLVADAALGWARPGCDIDVVPGVSSAMAAAAAAVETLTLPEITQTVILTRMEGRTPMPEGESLRELARHHSTLCLFLSISLLREVRQALLEAGWSDTAPVVVVHKASWPGAEQIVRGTLADIRERCKAARINSQAMIIVSPALGARDWPDIRRSKLYDPDFSHRFRQAERTA